VEKRVNGEVDNVRSSLKLVLNEFATVVAKISEKELDERTEDQRTNPSTERGNAIGQANANDQDTKTKTPSSRYDKSTPDVNKEKDGASIEAVQTAQRNTQTQVQELKFAQKELHNKLHELEGKLDDRKREFQTFSASFKQELQSVASAGQPSHHEWEVKEQSLKAWVDETVKSWGILSEAAQDDLIQVWQTLHGLQDSMLTHQAEAAQQVVAQEEMACGMSKSMEAWKDEQVIWQQQCVTAMHALRSDIERVEDMQEIRYTSAEAGISSQNIIELHISLAKEVKAVQASLDEVWMQLYELAADKAHQQASIG
jgi:hypothetical protein